jgi:hypothetical protein
MGQGVEPILGPVYLIKGLHALAAAGEKVGVVIGILSVGESPLMQVVEAFSGLGLAFGAGERGQQQAGKDRDDCDDDQQLN